MATIGTVTITLADTSSMTEAEAGQIANAIQDAIVKRYRSDARVTSCSPIFTTDTATITIA